MRKRPMGVVSLCLAAMVALLAGGAARADDLPLASSVSQHGITWTFSQPAPVGRFVNGDYYVVGPVTVSGISPLPASGRNGSVLNLPTNGRAGFDSRTPGGRYDASQFRAPPVSMVPGDSLISTISVDQMNVLPRMLRPSDMAISAVKTAAVLTCMAEQVPADAFRPAYCDTSNTVYLARNLRRNLLPSVPRSRVTEGRPSSNVLWRVALDGWDVTALANWERVFQRVWIDTVYDGFASPIDNMAQYGREYARAVGIAMLLMCCDYTPEEKEPVLIGLVQLGIDLWGAIRAGHPGWGAHGGHFNGRKLPIVFAGYLFNDPAMMNPQSQYPNVTFSEDMQTIHGQGWTGATALYGGHMGPDGHPSYPGWGAYEHLQPQDWEATIGEDYRRCCTSISFISEGLAFLMMHAEDVWNHPAFFDYCDRWMTEDDTQHIQQIYSAIGVWYGASWQRQRQCWDPFVESMWAMYRNNLPPGPSLPWEVLADHGPAGEVAAAADDGYVEPRLAGLRRLRVTFPDPVDPATLVAGAVTITGQASGNVSSLIESLSLDASGRAMTIALSASPPDTDTYTVAVTDVLRTLGGTPVEGDTDVVLRLLAGDVNGSGAVTPVDVLAARGLAGQALTAENARLDVNASGQISGADMLAVRLRLGRQLP